MEVDGPEDAPPIELEPYIANYSSHTKIDRLEFIAGAAAGTPLELDALRIAATELKQGDNTTRYAKIIDKIGGRLGPEFTCDKAWVDATDRKARQQWERLEALLNGYKSNLIKESIRMGHNDLGDFYHSRGDLQAAFKCYVRTRDYCTTPKHLLTMCLNVIRVSIEMRNFVHTANYVQKAETPELTDPVVVGKLKCAAGLAALANKKFKIAARRFVEVPVELGANYSEVFSPQDVATYGGLCALASFDRDELNARVINNIPFLEFLELVPEVREMIHDYYNSRYASCLKYMEAIKPALDLYLADCVKMLYKSIRSRALIQYTTPFTSVQMGTMAAAFNTTVRGLEEELSTLIMENQIQARIDSHKQILYARHADSRTATFQRVLSMGRNYERDAKAALLRANLRKHDFVQRQKLVGGRGVGMWAAGDT
eukprot:CAMPEP_0177788702 /NCGR_PEP_ID=MMETSP0491_2-20121128/22288_1 /TAXON_ID=63592 /ORGANISM="Tetraselmis chuii, Strain PLY429" /LENGTH=427 /DNA_ID=CAMNT_0019310379 /DNA_START=219 /DNA_END=1503 /DNA_ORIENTATION=+